ncbi:hypothetical protein TWF718_009629 [Orbilia javanica]|uniref:Secreted protein n=1 Tax=Orbilia javanica TaxID=47235 RepID=A0AAN8MZJ3_9PEZI
MFSRLLSFATLVLGIQAAATPKPTDSARFSDAERQALIDDGWTIVNGTGKPYYTGDDKLEKRTSGGVYMCIDANWKGDCGYKVHPLDSCVQLGSPWYHQISAIGPDQLTLLKLFKDNNCADRDWVDRYCGNGGPCLPTVYYPGYRDLSQQYFASARNPGNYNDQIGSFWVKWTTLIPE